ncbi:sulfur carrier protein ThiS [Bhargavaea beijingensis]|uniref:Sulfur carrier protein n=1 Tax=Bhargavaea beijingensis TaxID=426756 RepID=A0A1G7D2U8_9BACL|nr:sulfur carrier protein ThiS [Bhargavaea beijingensis]MCW1926962.1 sulfur carrier protein ThiS [Bhargavaea beijingensis]RSK24432.1 sulfur carrier protein ThiS [Bhargavaea beijingensis]SDE45827.1 sulfur carrier protein [Bhargavaea beijingensis]
MEKVIKLNGKKYEVPKGVGTVRQLLDHLDLSDRIAVIEKNQSIVPKGAYEEPVNDKDQIEIIHFVGGG